MIISPQCPVDLVAVIIIPLINVELTFHKHPSSNQPPRFQLQDVVVAYMEWSLTTMES